METQTYLLVIKRVTIIPQVLQTFLLATKPDTWQKPGSKTYISETYLVIIVHQPGVMCVLAFAAEKIPPPGVPILLWVPAQVLPIPQDSQIPLSELRQVIRLIRVAVIQ